MKGAKNTDFDAIARLEEIQEAKSLISKSTAVVLLALVKDGKVPRWAVTRLKEVLKAARVRVNGG
ncbi:MAG: hypothetical protein SFT94_02195 [Pseudanabaenaceae cyanobacterium bins.68]|nr:hypothetical protein [Pseudanabaenaceae cyanobacterium bins.68]